MLPLSETKGNPVYENLYAEGSEDIFQILLILEGERNSSLARRSGLDRDFSLQGRLSLLSMQ